jgi:hypothetical protein
VKLDEKKKIVDELKDKFSKSKVVIVTDYKGLDVTTINSLRRELRESQVEYRVVKNTLLIRAAENTPAAFCHDRCSHRSGQGAKRCTETVAECPGCCQEPKRSSLR